MIVPSIPVTPGRPEKTCREHVHVREKCLHVTNLTAGDVGSGSINVSPGWKKGE